MYFTDSFIARRYPAMMDVGWIFARTRLFARCRGAAGAVRAQCQVGRGKAVGAEAGGGGRGGGRAFARAAAAPTAP